MEFFVEDLDSPLSFARDEFDALYTPSSSAEGCDDIIDLSKINFDDDQNWLVPSSDKSSTDLRKFLHGPEDCQVNSRTSTSSKNIDTRTFTRPKKRFTRPSIEKYNEELYGEARESELNGCLPEEVPSMRPLHFDLSQPTDSIYFDNILAKNMGSLDTFQNMSPPSLVNSMCSSTFTNLMENSYIKNDPVLREIRDTDFTVSVLENEAMSQSVTESCSSLNSDVLDNILQNVPSSDKTVTKTLVEDLDGTFIKNDRPANRTITTKANGDFETGQKGALNCTYLHENAKEDVNVTVNINQAPSADITTNQNVKRLLDRRPSPSMDLNRLSYIIENKASPQKVTVVKENSFGSTDSMENADFMSLSSGSSKSSNKRTSIEGMNAIGEIHEQALRQIMSTPKTRVGSSTWPVNDISPISGRNSDPELSSSTSPTIASNTIRKQKSANQLNQRIAKKIDSRTIGRGPPSNLNSMGHALKGSYTSLKPLNTNLPVAPPPLNATQVLQSTESDAQFVKPQPPKPSALPRPVTGIPRPVSRIPGPRSIRPPSKSATLQGRH